MWMSFVVAADPNVYAKRFLLVEDVKWKSFHIGTPEPRIPGMKTERILQCAPHNLLERAKKCFGDLLTGFLSIVV